MSGKADLSKQFCLEQPCAVETVARTGHPMNALLKRGHLIWQAAGQAVTCLRLQKVHKEEVQVYLP